VGGLKFAQKYEILSSFHPNLYYKCGLSINLALPYCTYEQCFTTFIRPVIASKRVDFSHMFVLFGITNHSFYSNGCAGFLPILSLPFSISSLILCLNLSFIKKQSHHEI
jgi:hypothetical protein